MLMAVKLCAYQLALFRFMEIEKKSHGIIRNAVDLCFGELEDGIFLHERPDFELQFAKKATDLRELSSGSSVPR